MKPEKAIEITKDILYRRTVSLNQDQKDALELNIEAQERHLARYSLTFAGMMQPLPGETKD